MSRSLRCALFACVVGVACSLQLSLRGKDAGPEEGSEAGGLPCGTYFNCPDCMRRPRCGWCVTRGETGAKLCQDSADRIVVCTGPQDDWIGQTPAGQLCPDTLHDGTSAGPKRERAKADGGIFTSERYENVSFWKGEKPRLGKRL